MLVTIPLPIPVPEITIVDNEVKIDRAATELAIKARSLGQLLTIDDEKSAPICCACKKPQAHYATHEPPEGFRWGGWFCGHCLGQGELAKRLGLIIDQITCEVVR